MKHSWILAVFLLAHTELLAAPKIVLLSCGEFRGVRTEGERLDVTPDGINDDTRFVFDLTNRTVQIIDSIGGQTAPLLSQTELLAFLVQAPLGVVIYTYFPKERLMLMSHHKIFLLNGAPVGSLFVSHCR